MTEQAAMRDPTWNNVRELVILSHVAATGRLGDDMLAKDICEQVKRLAEANAPFPVECVGFGDRRLHEPGYISLLVHSSIDRTESSQRIVYAMRTSGKGELGIGGSYFGAAPRVAPYSGSASENEAFEIALRVSLGEVLPWLRPAETGGLSPI